MIKRGASDISDCDGTYISDSSTSSRDSTRVSETVFTPASMVNNTVVELDTNESSTSSSSIRSCRKVTNASGEYIFNQRALQRYVLHCGQDLKDGGLRDKPDKPRDFYHRYVCYLCRIYFIIA
jgi:hypothetical protein